MTDETKLENPIKLDYKLISMYPLGRKLKHISEPNLIAQVMEYKLTKHGIYITLEDIKDEYLYTTLMRDAHWQWSLVEDKE